MSYLVKTKSIFTPEGRIAVFEEEDDVLYKFEYKLKDHLGNTRVVFGGHTSGKVEHIQRTAYYPFGLVMDQQDYITFAGLNSKHAPFENKFLYNGKEWQNEEIGGMKLDWYDFQTRFMDPQLARFHSIDLLSEKYSFQSPYAYAANNPIRYIDFLGMGPDDPPGFWQSFGSTLGTYFEGAMTGVVDRIYEPSLLVNDAANAVEGIMTLASDVTGISNLVENENQTANALGEAINTISELPNMTSAEQGAVAAGINNGGRNTC